MGKRYLVLYILYGNSYTIHLFAADDDAVDDHDDDTDDDGDDDCEEASLLDRI